MNVDGLLAYVKISAGKQCEFVQFAERFLDGYLKTTIDVKTFAACEFDGNHRKTIQTMEQHGLAAPAITTAFNALPPALGTITPVIRATGFVVITSK
nr:hypothetical protein [Tanacetum cinerariifolium]